MNHEQIKDKIFEFYDGELNSEDSRFLQAHLNSCSECRGELADWKKTSAVFFRNSTPMESTDYFVARVMARLPEPPLRASFLSSPFLKLGFAFAGFFVVVWSYLSMSLASTDSIETLLLADSRTATVSNWVLGDDVIPGDEFARYTLGGE